MKIALSLLAILIVGLSTLTPSFAEDPPTTRMLVMVTGESVPSNQILFQYADSMDMGAIENLAQASPTQIIPFQTLIGQLPQPPPGWTGDSPNGMVLNTGTFSYSFASKEYQKTGGEDSVTVVIWDTVGEQMGPWFAFWYGSGFYYETQDGYLKGITYNGYRAVEQRDHTDNSGHLLIGLVRETQIPEMGLFGILALASGGLLVFLRKTSGEL